MVPLSSFIASNKSGTHARARRAHVIIWAGDCASLRSVLSSPISLCALHALKASSGLAPGKAPIEVSEEELEGGQVELHLCLGAARGRRARLLQHARDELQYLQRSREQKIVVDRLIHDTPAPQRSAAGKGVGRRAAGCQRRSPARTLAASDSDPKVFAPRALAPCPNATLAPDVDPLAAIGVISRGFFCSTGRAIKRHAPDEHEGRLLRHAPKPRAAPAA